MTEPAAAAGSQARERVGTRVVVGGGIAGLLAARRLAAAGHRVTLLEAGPQLGGRVSPVKVAGLTLDAGAESFSTRGGSVAALINEVGLGSEVLTPRALGTWVVGPDAAYPLPVTGWLGIPLEPMAKDVQAALGVSGAQRALQDLDLPMGRLRAGITVGELGRQRLGDVAVDRLMAPALSASFGRPVDDLPLDAIAPGLAAEVESHGGLIAAARARQATVTKGPAIQSIRGGMYRLTEALAADAARHGAQLLTNRRVQRVVPGASGWRVRCDDQTLEADAVVLAVPRHVLPALLPADAVDAVDAVDASADAPVAAAWVSVVTLVVNSRALDTAPRGVGVLVRPGMTSVTTAVTHLTHSTAKWEWLDDLAGGRHVLRLSYAVTEPSLDMTGHALADACALLGVGIPDSAVLGVATTVWPDSSPVRVENLEPLPGITLVGSAAGKSGLAAIAAQDATLR